MSKGRKNVKIWTTIPRELFEEAKNIGANFGYADAELFRELIRKGLISFRQLTQIRLPPKGPKETGAILKVAEKIGDSVSIQDMPKRVKESWK